MIARAIIRRFLRRIVTGTLVVSENGERVVFGSGSPVATVQVHSPRVWRWLLRGSAGMADAYADGLWDSPDLVALVRLGARNAPALDRARRRWRLLLVPFQQIRGLTRRGTRERNRRDIAAHYDLGNQLFSRMLDPTMTYSCAVFEDDRMSLEEAQRRKLERICQKLELAPGDRVLEIGTGWGGFALYAAATRGCHVTTTTISAEQYAYARERVRAAGLEDRIEVLRHDYRDLAGTETYDKLVSIEMIEAVGWRHFGTFFAKCRELLAPGGTMLLQAITIDDRAYAVEKASRSFMSTRIFPGGCLPSLAVITEQLSRRTDLQVVDLDDITEHYVPTLRAWRQSFLEHTGELVELGYDERFRRTWTLYLAYCEAGFAERRICDVQLLLARPPWRARTLRLEKSSIGVREGANGWVTTPDESVRHR